MTAEALKRGQCARLIRKTRTALSLSQSEFAERFRGSVGRLHDWEEARVTALDFAIAYVRVIGQYPDMVAKVVAYTGTRAADAAAPHGIKLEVIKLPEAKRGFVLLPRRWVFERSFAWATRFRRLVKDYERYAQILAGLHVVAFACIMIKQAVAIAADS